MFERRLFHGLFGTEDQKEGMAAFVEKRPADVEGEIIDSPSSSRRKPGSREAACGNLSRHSDPGFRRDDGEE